jgi:hypothetical protein
VTPPLLAGRPSIRFGTCPSGYPALHARPGSEHSAPCGHTDHHPDRCTATRQKLLRTASTPISDPRPLAGWLCWPTRHLWHPDSGIVALPAPPPGPGELPNAGKLALYALATEHISRLITKDSITAVLRSRSPCSKRQPARARLRRRSSARAGATLSLNSSRARSVSPRGWRRPWWSGRSPLQRSPTESFRSPLSPE